MSETLVRVECVSKKFCLNLGRSLWYGVRDLSSELMGRRHGGHGGLRPQEFWAVRDVDFELARGECLGLIGRNGAGKTTLLRMLNGLIKPDAGRIELRGRVGALIALGAGFNPVLTGRENIYVNAAMLGLAKHDVDVRLDEIVAFAEIEQFLDTPVRNYSSGMSVRLGFSVAAVLLRPDVLFLDEVLAVGDIGFVVKCLNTVRRLSDNAAVVLVSHNMTHIATFCTRVMTLEGGSVRLDTREIAAGIDLYYQVAGRQDVRVDGAGGADVLDFALEVGGERRPETEPTFALGDLLAVRARLRVDAPVRAAHVVVNVVDESMTPVVSCPVVTADGAPLELATGEHELSLPLWKVDLNRGRYSFVVIARGADDGEALTRVQGLSPFRVHSDRSLWGKLVRPVTAATLLPARER